MKVTIIGQGLFGTFLQHECESQGVLVVPDADIVLLAVPSSAYEEVAQKYKNKHLVNICSVQENTNKICIQSSKRVTGIHPMFGPRSPKENWTSVVTHTCFESEKVFSLFRSIGSKIIKTLPDGRLLNGKIHDEMMALTHGATIKMADQLKPLVKEAHWIPDECLPSSFKRLKEVVEQLGDMAPGTESSILSNPYL